ncbi:MAG: hypothetical protein LQ346_003331 [Caloplaca aetnensis]|nr:MAG: hypothetical protein LQ346_003331 [Caloplaca aetnensis]
MIASPSAWAEVTSHNPSRQGYAGGIRELRWGIGERTREKSHNQLKKRMRSVGDALLASHALRSYGKQEKRSAIGKIANTDQWIVAASVGAKVTVVEINLGVATTVYGTDNLPVKPKIARSMVMLNPAYANRTATGRMPVNSYGLGGQVSSIIPTTGDAATAFHCSYHEPNEAATASTRVETVHKDEYAVESR